jgi:hypothetical protein
MARGKEKTPEQKRRDRDKRYHRDFNIGIDFYDALLAEQCGCCGACGRPATDFTVSLNIDHEHFKVHTDRVIDSKLLALNLRWSAWTILKDGRGWNKLAKTQKQAIYDLKREVLPHSIRGLLCPGRYTGCNRLMGRIDRIDWLEKVLAYLKNPPAKRLTLKP